MKVPVWITFMKGETEQGAAVSQYQANVWNSPPSDAMREQSDIYYAEIDVPLPSEPVIRAVAEKERADD